MSDHTESVKNALKFARRGECDRAQAEIANLVPVGLDTEQLRSLALVHGYCGNLHAAVPVWRLICERADAHAGDFYMLGSNGLGIENTQKAIAAFAESVRLSLMQPNAPYLSAAAINLARLQIDLGLNDAALTTLKTLADDESASVHGVGTLSKKMLLERLR